MKEKEHGSKTAVVKFRIPKEDDLAKPYTHFVFNFNINNIDDLDFAPKFELYQEKLKKDEK